MISTGLFHLSTASFVHSQEAGELGLCASLCDTAMKFLSSSRDGGTGRRSGLKIRRPLRSWGFDPPSRHHNYKEFTVILALKKRNGVCDCDLPISAVHQVVDRPDSYSHKEERERSRWFWRHDISSS